MTRTTKKPGSRAHADGCASGMHSTTKACDWPFLAALEAVYECFPHITLPQYLITLEVRKAERDG